MLSAICDSINNHFHIRDAIGNIIAERHEFTIDIGIIRPLNGKYHVGQYVRIVGSIFSAGIYQIERVGDGYIDVSIHDEDYAIWFQPTGGHDAWPMGARVIHDGIRYISLISANVQVPGSDTRWWEAVGEIEHSVRDEVFQGVIAPLAIPAAFISLVHEIERFSEMQAADPEKALITSESIGGDYSYSKATSANGLPSTWIDAFASRLNEYRKMFAEAI